MSAKSESAPVGTATAAATTPPTPNPHLTTVKERVGAGDDGKARNSLNQAALSAHKDVRAPATEG